MTRGELSVVQVAPTDRLNLRQNPSADSPIVVELAHDARGLVPTGNVCSVGKASWYEVKATGLVGWVHGTFAKPSTPSRDVTMKYRGRRLSRVSLSAAALAEKIMNKIRQNADPDEAYPVKLLGIDTKGPKAIAEIWICCFHDDSVMAEQISLEMHQNAPGGWNLVSASSRSICARGVSGDLCI